MVGLVVAWLVAGGAVVPDVPRSVADEADRPVCHAVGVLPPDLAAWSMVAFRNAASDVGALPGAGLNPGEAALVKLAPGAAVTYPRAPEKAASAGSFGGLLRLVVTTAGTYRVVLGTRAWIDMVARDGTAVAAVAHSQGPACTGIRKMVDFALAPGAYTLQLSGSAVRDSIVLVIRRP